MQGPLDPRAGRHGLRGLPRRSRAHLPARPPRRRGGDPGRRPPRHRRHRAHHACRSTPSGDWPEARTLHGSGLRGPRSRAPTTTPTSHTVLVPLPKGVRAQHAAGHEAREADPRAPGRVAVAVRRGPDAAGGAGPRRPALDADPVADPRAGARGAAAADRRPRSPSTPSRAASASRRSLRASRPPAASRAPTAWTCWPSGTIPATTRRPRRARPPPWTTPAATSPSASRSRRPRPTPAHPRPRPRRDSRPHHRRRGPHRRGYARARPGDAEDPQLPTPATGGSSTGSRPRRASANSCPRRSSPKRSPTSSSPARRTSR